MAEALKEKTKSHDIAVQKSELALKEATELKRLLAGAHGNNKVLMEQVISERKSREKMVEFLNERSATESRARENLRQELLDARHELKNETRERDELKRL